MDIASFPALREREEKELSDSSLRLGNKANSIEAMFLISYLWQSQVENVHYSGMQLLRKTRLKILIFIGL